MNVVWLGQRAMWRLMITLLKAGARVALLPEQSVGHGKNSSKGSFFSFVLILKKVILYINMMIMILTCQPQRFSFCQIGLKVLRS